VMRAVVAVGVVAYSGLCAVRAVAVARSVFVARAVVAVYFGFVAEHAVAVGHAFVAFCLCLVVERVSACSGPGVVRAFPCFYLAARSAALRCHEKWSREVTVKMLSL
jgi:hypothetical protein